jgi:hypothetical protein
MQNVTPTAIAALTIELASAVALGLAGERITRTVQRLPSAVRIACPALFVLPYILVSISEHIFRWHWFALYAGLPVMIAWLVGQATTADPEQRRNWRDAIMLLALGPAVDLRWSDWKTGLRELLFFTPIVLTLGLALGFIHPTPTCPR